MTAFKSLFAEKFQKYLDYRTALGYKATTYMTFLKQLDKYCFTEHPEDTVLSEDVVLGWLVRREEESQERFSMRCSFVRRLAEYFSYLGEEVYILPEKFCAASSNFVPYILSDSELHNLFSAIDAIEDPDPFVPYILSTAFRLVYTCGLRPNESRNLKRNDVNLITGEVTIHKTKYNRERVVVMSSDMLNLARNYAVIRDVAYHSSEYFFPNPKGEAYPSIWYQKHLAKAFRKTYPEAKEDEIPRLRVYDLRHRFASAVLMKWVDEGKSLYSRLPYLQSYMGHRNFASTAYYIHLLPEKIARSAGIDWNALGVLIPEVSAWED